MNFDKHSPTTRERKVPQGKNIRFFRLDTLKNFILNEKFVSGHFFSKLGHVFPIFEKEQGRLPLPPLVARLIWVKVFKNGPSKICGRQPLKKFYLLHFWIPWLISYITSFRVSRQKDVLRMPTLKKLSKFSGKHSYLSFLSKLKIRHPAGLFKKLPVYLCQFLGTLQNC